MSERNQTLIQEVPQASRRGLLLGTPAVAAAALVGGTVANALAMSDAAGGLDWPAIILRAGDVTDKLQKYYGRDWTAADQEAAAGVLKYCRDRGAGLPDDEQRGRRRSSSSGITANRLTM
jgi:hypothetical protein